jgi:hypothetical protein
MTREIPLTKGFVTVVDDADYEWLSQWKWCAMKTVSGLTYAMRMIGPRGKQKRVLMHRLLANTPPHLVTDHINGNPLDNRRVNLRNCTLAENLRNCRPNTTASSPYKGVSRIKSTGKWEARIKTNGVGVYLGTFADESAAARAYDSKAREIFGEFAFLNFPNEQE